VPAAKDDAKCDDHDVCTIDTCTASGCAHAPNTGATCNDGDACHAAGTCNGAGTCAAAAVPDTAICAGQGVCPGGFYPSASQCNGFCGQCPFCINAFTCTFACKPEIEVCCGNDCAGACPAGYAQKGAPTKKVACGCGDAAPGDMVTCARTP
jgi:hypothetical protein